MWKNNENIKYDNLFVSYYFLLYFYNKIYDFLNNIIEKGIISLFIETENSYLIIIISFNLLFL